MNRNRSLVLFLGLALAAMLSCSGAESPLGPQLGGETTAVDPAPPPVDSAAVPVNSGTVTPVDSVPVPSGNNVPPISWQPLDIYLLSCRAQPYAVTTAVIGPSGGQIIVGNHSLKILENALSEDVTITAEQVEGAVNSVRFSPEGLRFAVPAVLTLSYKNCDNVRHSKRVVYTDEMLNVLESPLSFDFSNRSQVKSLINHFSRYAVAY